MLAASKSVQLEAVRDKIDEKLTSWASAVEKKVMQKEMKKAAKLAMNEQDREYNVIMFNVQEQESDDDSDDHDGDVAPNIMKSAVLGSSDGEFST